MFTWFLKCRAQESTLVSGHEGQITASNDGGTLPATTDTIATHHNEHNTAVAVLLQQGSGDHPSSRNAITMTVTVI